MEAGNGFIMKWYSKTHAARADGDNHHALQEPKELTNAANHAVPIPMRSPFCVCNMCRPIPARTSSIPRTCHCISTSDCLLIFCCDRVDQPLVLNLILVLHLVEPGVLMRVLGQGGGTCCPED